MQQLHVHNVKDYTSTLDPPEESTSDFGGGDVVENRVDGRVDIHKDAESIQHVEVHFLCEVRRMWVTGIMLTVLIWRKSECSAM